MRLPDTGRYTLLVGDSDHTHTGTYNLYLQRTNSPANPSPIAFGETATGTIDNPVQYKTYTFNANGGDQVYYKMQVGWDTGYAKMRLYAPNGTPLAYSSSAKVTDQQTASSGYRDLQTACRRR